MKGKVAIIMKAKCKQNESDVNTNESKIKAPVMPMKAKWN
jgi:hypothetical protein